MIGKQELQNQLKGLSPPAEIDNEEKTKKAEIKSQIGDQNQDYQNELVIKVGDSLLDTLSEGANPSNGILKAERPKSEYNFGRRKQTQIYTKGTNLLSLMSDFSDQKSENAPRTTKNKKREVTFSQTSKIDSKSLKGKMFATAKKIQERIRRQKVKDRNLQK